MGAAFVDPLGFLLFGPTLGAELRVGPASVLVYGRWFSVGMLSNSMFIDGEEEFAFSHGAGLGARYWVGEALSGVHVGVLAEYLSSQIDDETVLITSTDTFFVPQLEGGFRLPLAGFFIGGRAQLGYAIRLTSTIEDLPGGSSANLYEVDDANQLYGSASLDVGVYF
jgi:hypothetical protein